MAFEFDENPPVNYHYLVALPTPQKSSDTLPEDYNWLERLLPYSSDCESNIHWFVRFK